MVDLEIGETPSTAVVLEIGETLKAPHSTTADLEIGEAVTTVDLEIGEGMKAARSATVDLEIGEAVIPPPPAWVQRMTGKKPRRVNVWTTVSMVAGLISAPFFIGLYLKLEPYGYQFIAIWLLFSSNFAFIIFMCYALARDSHPYVLRRSEKLYIESAFVVVSSFWTFLERDDDILTAILGLVLLFRVIPCMNLWWDFTNFDFWDCCSAVFIDAALVVCGRFFGGIALMAVAALGVALHYIKNAYRQYSYQKIKNERQTHLI